jgi:hypothetical protein
MVTQDEINAVMRELASRGGKAKSPRKTEANRQKAIAYWKSYKGQIAPPKAQERPQSTKRQLGEIREPILRPSEKRK